VHYAGLDLPEETEMLLMGMGHQIHVVLHEFVLDDGVIGQHGEETPWQGHG
jgi:hypothetical protein